MRDFTEKIPVAVITGPTATGKTALAVRLAKKFNGEIVSVDSRQVYCGMDIGSGKDLAEYGDVPYHLLDVADPAKELYHLHRFCQEAFSAIRLIRDRGRLPVLCGGSVLYLAALIDGYTLPGEALPARSTGERHVPQAGKAPSFQPPFRLEPLLLGVLYPRSVVRERIKTRLDARFAEGMVEEVRRLHDEKGVSWEQLEFFGLEYREIARYLQDLVSFEEMRETLLNKIRQFAKRQDIFFRKLEREGHRIYWLKEGREPDPEMLLARFLAGQALPELPYRLCDNPNPARPE